MNGSTRSRSAERPPALKAVIAICASDDRYTDDVHDTGGAAKLLDLVDYPLYMLALNALPPVPAVAGPEWRERWRARVEGLEPWLLRWLEEQADGPYWRQGSLRPTDERIACPTMLVAGWADGYRNATFRMLERLRAGPAAVRALEPHGHRHLGARAADRPGPRAGPVVGRWLRGRRNGVDEAPPVTVFVRHATRPAPRPGRARRQLARRTRLAPGTDQVPDRPAVRRRPRLRGCRPVGGARRRRERGLDQLRRSAAVRQPDDQRSDDAWSLVYDWELDEELEILGHPRLAVRVGSSAPVAFLSAKLCDVFPTGPRPWWRGGFSIWPSAGR
jgi:predicted acyl esterase